MARYSGHTQSLQRWRMPFYKMRCVDKHTTLEQKMSYRNHPQPRQPETETIKKMNSMNETLDPQSLSRFLDASRQYLLAVGDAGQPCPVTDAAYGCLSTDCR